MEQVLHTMAAATSVVHLESEGERGSMAVSVANVSPCLVMRDTASSLTFASPHLIEHFPRTPRGHMPSDSPRPRTLVISLPLALESAHSGRGGRSGTS
jgi:hypothetical protein